MLVQFIMTNNRQSIRIRNYDYSKPGYYFVTICTHQMQPLFGNILDGQMRLNDAGEMVKQEWEQLPNYYPSVDKDSYQIMPNHFHGIIILDAGAPFTCAQYGYGAQKQR